MSQKSWHICFISIDHHFQQSGGGIASYVQTLGQKLVELGFYVTIIANGKKRLWHSANGINILFWPLGSLHWYWYRSHLPKQAILPLREIEWSLGIWQALREVQRKQPVDLVEGCEGGNLFIQYLNLPLVMRLHGEAYVFAKYSGQPIHAGLQLNRQLELMALRRATGVTSPSRFQADEVAHDLKWPTDRIQVIPNPISPMLLKSAIDSNGGIDSRKSSVVLYTGRIEDRKGSLPLLRSVANVSKSIPDVRYVIAGGRHNSIDDATLNRVLDKDNVRAHVSLLGHVPWDDLASWYRQASIFVMPSYYETFGISVIEAMAFGLPIVATTAGGLPEVVEDGVTGILVPPGEPQALGEAIIRLLRDPGLCKRMGKAGQKRVLAEFTVDKTVNQTLNYYHKLVI